MLQALTLLWVALPAAAAGVALGVAVGRRGALSTSLSPSTSPSLSQRPSLGGGDGAGLRGQALEVAAEPVLIVGGDGRVRDCNAAALSMLARHRTEVSGVDAASLRALMGEDGRALEWAELVAGRAPWSGDAHVRLPDGSRSRSTVRVVPVFADDASVAALVEVYHGRGDHPALTRPQFVHALPPNDAADAELGDAPEAAQRELRLLSLAFADIARVLRQYELLLPAMRAEDPLTESIAGLAAETRELATLVDVARLLEEVPRVLDRLQRRVHQLGTVPPGTTDTAD